MKKTKLYNVTLTNTELTYLMSLLESKQEEDGAAEELLVEIKLQTIWGEPKQ